MQRMLEVLYNGEGRGRFFEGGPKCHAKPAGRLSKRLGKKIKTKRGEKKG